MSRVLLIDPNGEIGHLVEGVFDAADIEFAQVNSLDANLQVLQELSPQAVISGWDATQGEGWDRFGRLRQRRSRLPVLLLCLDGCPPWTALEQVRALAFDVLACPVNPADWARRIRFALKTAVDSQSPVLYGSAELFGANEEVMVGHSASMQKVFGSLPKLAQSEACVLITGETGTGKSLLARCLHHHSTRRKQLLVTVDCSSRWNSLESELFGNPGHHPISRFEQAASGTLFLRHIERLPLPIQAKLAEALREQSHSNPLEPLAPRVRLLASAAHSLEQCVAERLFREDLYDAVARTRVNLPPLRDRPEDLLPLASYFLRRCSAGSSQPEKSLSAIVSHVLSCYGWPNNVRELEQALRRAYSFASSNLIQLGDLSADLLSAVGPALLNSSSSPNSRAVDPEPAGLTELSCQLFRWARKDAQFRIIPAMERELIVHAMAETGGNQAQAARLLGITRATLRKRLVRFRIQREVLIR